MFKKHQFEGVLQALFSIGVPITPLIPRAGSSNQSLSVSVLHHTRMDSWQPFAAPHKSGNTELSITGKNGE